MFSSGYPSVSNSILKFCFKRNWICKVLLVNLKNKKFSRNFFIHLAPAVQRVYNTIHWVNHHPLHNSIGFYCLVDYRLSNGQVICLPFSAIQPLNNSGAWTLDSSSIILARYQFRLCPHRLFLLQLVFWWSIMAILQELILSHIIRFPPRLPSVSD